MEPRLALSYSSQVGNGLLGVGWSLSGLSAITRCPRTVAQDGVRGSIGFDLNDRYCLDGQRLILVSGSEGLAGAEYRTERDSFSRIVAYGNAGNGPSYFVVKTKSGLTIEYGNSADSKIEAQGKSSVRVWAQNKVSDTKSNYYTITYTEDNANGEYYPIRIDYAGNANTGAIPRNSLVFSYEAKPEPSEAWLVGTKIRSSVRLADLRAYVDGVATQYFQLLYQQSPTTQRSRLVGVNRCDAVSSNCYPPFSFSWQANANATFQLNGASGLASGAFPQGSESDYITGDFNGDGITDIAAFHRNNNGTSVYTWLALANLGGAFTQKTGSGLNGGSFPQASSSQFLTGDVNGDGLTDIVALCYSSSGSSGYTWVALANGDGTFRLKSDSGLASGSFPQGSESKYTSGDFNGDGLTDFAAFHRNDNGTSVYTWVALANADGSFTLKSGSGLNGGAFPQSSASQFLTGDVNGDGRTDIVALSYSSSGSSSYTWVALANSDGSFSLKSDSGLASGSFPQGSESKYITGDFNGDGLTDIAAFHRNGDGNSVYTWVALAKGDGSFTLKSGSGLNGGAFPQSAASRFLSGDVNGDGLTDIIALSYSSSGSSSYTWIALANGDGSFRLKSDSGLASGSFPQGSESKYLTGDFNGDGATDFVAFHFSSNGASQYTWASATGLAGVNTPELIGSFTNGLVTASHSYGKLTQDEVYQKGSGAIYPVQDLRFPMYVVSSSSLSNGIGGVVTSNYKYGVLRAELGGGRGLLGFNWIENTQAETGLVSRIVYRQDWPYIGYPSETKKSKAGAGNNGVLTSTAMTYACLDPISGNACTSGIGKIYFPYASQSTESNWDLDGSTLPVVTTNNAFDRWGNATQVTITQSDGSSKTTTNTYNNDTGNWYLGRLLRSVVTSSTP